ncbi:MAG: hypothetical protein WBG69_04485 [Arcobacteraceae bacterium]
MDRIKHIQKLQSTPYKQEPRQTMVLGNFYAIITIIIVCLSMLYYVNYIQPAQKAKAQRELKIQEHQKFLDERAKRIALSHKLNKKDYNETK